MNTPRRVLAAVSIFSAVVAALVSRRLFPLLSSDNDEAIYRLQAQTMAHGHLFPAAPAPPASFTPWLAAVVGHHYVLKYTPFVSGLYALSLWLTGSFVPAMALVAAAAVWVTYALANELLGDDWAAALAAIVVGASPLVIVQSGLLLAYLPTLVLLEAFAWALVRGMRTQAGWTVTASGAALGLATATRTYDAVLLAGPIVAWAGAAIVRCRHLRLAGWWLLGALLPLAVLLAFDAAATGHALHLPFGLLEHSDALGFGRHRLYPGDQAHKFGVRQGWAALRTHLWLLAQWCFGGLVLAVLAVMSLVRGRVSPPAKALLVGALFLAVGYMGFWGAWAAAYLWGGVHYLGPFYLLPVLMVIAILGAAGMMDLLRRYRKVAVALLATVSVASAVVLTRAIDANRSFTHQDQALARLVSRQTAPALIFVDVDPPFLMHPSAVVANNPSSGNGPMFALLRGADDFAVLAGQPGRIPYRLQLGATVYRTPETPWGARLERVRLTSASSFNFHVPVRDQRPDGGMEIVVTWQGEARTYPLPAPVQEASVAISAAGVKVGGLEPNEVRARPVDGFIWLELRSVPGSGGAGGQLGVVRFPAVVDGAGVRAIVPAGPMATLGAAPPVLEVTIG